MLNLRNYRLALTLLIILLPIKTYASDSLTELALKKIEALEQRLNSVETDNRNLRAELKRVSKRTQPSLKEIPEKVNYETFENYNIGKINNTSSENKIVNNDTSLWPGIYGGINAGYGAGSQNLYETAAGKPFWGNNFSFHNTSDTRNTSGVLAGIQLGYNYVFANNILVGSETDIDWADVSNRDKSKQFVFGWRTSLDNYDTGLSSGDKGLTRSNSRFGMSLFGTTRIRLGYDFGKFLPFISGGLAWGDLTYFSQGMSVRNSSSSTQFGLDKNYASKIATGWAVGAGAEYMVTNNLSLKGEYLYSQIGGMTIPGYGFDLSDPYTTTYFANTVKSSSFITQQARFGLNYHTGWAAHIPNLIQTRD